MKIKQYQVDAFTDQVFKGNPAAVCPLEAWLDDALLQSIAAENNLSETAFFVKAKTGYNLRWFTPVTEVNLCGHATLAAAHVIFEHLGYPGSVIHFETHSGRLNVERQVDIVAMDFPSKPPVPCAAPEALLEGLGGHPLEVYAADDYFVVFDSENAVRAIKPNFGKLSTLDLRGVVITARGNEADFVSRFFAPKFGIPEDPVTGSAHCELTPYWTAKLDKPILNARQISKRGGDIQCEMKGDRVGIAGRAVTYMEADIFFNKERK